MRIGHSVCYVLAIISIGMIGIVMQGCSKNELTDMEYVAKAKEYHDKGEYRAAVIEAKNALKVNSKNAEARWFLGQVYLEVGNGPAAEKELVRAQSLGVDDEAIIPLLLESLLLQAKYLKVLEQNIAVLKSNNVLASAHASRGLAYLFLKRFEEARDEFENALEYNLALSTAMVGQARLALVDKNGELASQLIEKALSVNGLYAPAWSVKGDILQLEGDKESSIKAYSKAIENQYNNGADLLKRSMLYIELERFEEARNDLARLKKRFPKHPQVNYAQGVLAFYEGKYDEAQAQFESSLKTNSSNIRTTYYLGAVQYLQKNYEQAKNYLTRYVDAVPRHIPGRKLLAVISLEGKEFSLAEELIRPVVKAEPEDVFSLNILANALIGLDRADEALPLLEKMVLLEPESAAAFTRLSVGLLSKGDVSGGQAALKTAIEIDPQFHQAEIMLVQSYLRDKDYDKAEEAALDFARRQPENVVAYNLLGAVYISVAQEQEAKQAFNNAINVMPGNPTALIGLARIALQNGDVDQARKYYQDILEVNAGHLLTLLKLADLEAKLGNREAEIAARNQAVKQNPEAIQAKVLLAREYLRDRKIEDARALFSDITDEDRNNPYVLGMLGEIQLAVDDFVGAKLTFQRLIDNLPNQSQSHFLLAKAYKGLKENALYRQELEKALSLKPDNLMAKIALAELMVAEGQAEAANEHLDFLKNEEALKGAPELLVLEGKVLLSTGKNEQALSVYKELFELFPNTSTVLTLAGQEWSMGNERGATDRLEQWLSEYPDDVNVRLMLAGHYLASEQQNDAVLQYRKVLELSEKNIFAMNNLAWYLRKSSPDEALAIAEKASALAPESVAIMDTLAAILIEKGEYRRAERYIDRALRKFPDNPRYLYHRVLILEKTAGVEIAKNELEALLEMHGDFSDIEQAKQLLKKYKAM